MPNGHGHHRLLIYSHDSFGLGHLRRCRAIAHALVDRRSDLSVLILSGSPIIGSFSFRNRVDFVRIPGVIKLRDGDYSPLKLNIGIEQTLQLRASIISHTAEVFAPDVFLVDKEPLGLRGEVRETLAMLKARGIPLVLGLRDVMDDPATLAEEWRRKNAVPALAGLYDHIWVYGLPEICDPLQGVPVPAAVHNKVHFTGYIRRTLPDGTTTAEPWTSADTEPYILVTTGGGGDGAAVIDWVLKAYEHDPRIPWRARVVFGPFMHSRVQSAFRERVARLESVDAITFDANLETLIAHAAGIVAMGGYNTFCEILSFDKPALLVPRTVPRLEQAIRAERASVLGLVRTLPLDGDRDPILMAAAIRALPFQPRPSQTDIPALLDGLSEIGALVDGWLDTSLARPDRPAAVRLPA